METPNPLLPFKRVIEKQQKYIACQEVAKKAHRKTAVAACALCFVLGVLAGMFLVDQHYKSATKTIELEFEPADEMPEPMEQAARLVNI